MLRKRRGTCNVVKMPKKGREGGGGTEVMLLKHTKKVVQTFTGLFMKNIFFDFIGWVYTLVGGQKEGARGFMFFIINVDLTEEGLCK